MSYSDNDRTTGIDLSLVRSILDRDGDAPVPDAARRPDPEPCVQDPDGHGLDGAAQDDPWDHLEDLLDPAPAPAAAADPAPSPDHRAGATEGADRPCSVPPEPEATEPEATERDNPAAPGPVSAAAAIADLFAADESPAPNAEDGTIIPFKPTGRETPADAAAEKTRCSDGRDDPAPKAAAPSDAPRPRDATVRSVAGGAQGALGDLIALQAGESVPVEARHLLSRAYAGFRPTADRLAGFEAALEPHAGPAGGGIAAEARRLRKKLKDFEPSVAVIGQVKAGKTTLINALSGRPGLLPADVNPWTSVVTSLHLGPDGGDGQERAAFQFFDEAAWANLVQRGGRVGDLAGRAGANDELDKIRRQLEEMRAKSRQRLGRRFEMLLGQTHVYDSFDAELIARYVCMGDDFWEDDNSSRQRGRFADITRSADLWFPVPETPLRLCLRDTPGVNDTFMIREQITINALRGSRLCVVVLSAHQALTTVDLALIRLISNVKARDVVIFVNRIDELAAPATAIPEIRASIAATLKRFEVAEGVRLVFGSGHWAQTALTGDLEALGEASAAALLDYASLQPGETGPDGTDEPVRALLWRLSGLPELCDALAERVETDLGAKFAAQIAAATDNLARSAAVAADDGAPRASRQMAAPSIPASEIAAAEQKIQAALAARLAEIRATFDARIEKSRQTFLGRATASLLDHLDTHGDRVVWSYDPVGLRSLLRSAYQIYVRAAGKAGEEALADAAAELSALLAAASGDAEATRLTPPPPPDAPPPVALGQTIALDLRGSWWTRFWRKTRGYDAFAESFAGLIEEETRPILAALRTDAADPYELQLRAAVGEFFSGQRSILAGGTGAERPNAAAAAPVPRRLRALGDPTAAGRSPGGAAPSPAVDPAPSAPPRAPGRFARLAALARPGRRPQQEDRPE